MAVEDNGTVTLSESRARARSTPSETLFLLVEVDEQAALAERRAAELLQDARAFELELDRERKERDQKQHALKERQRQVAHQEAEIAELAGKRKRLDERTMRVTNPKELGALQEEIGKLEAAVAEAEGRLLELYEQQESEEKAVKQLETQLERTEKAVSRRTSELRSKSAELSLRATRLRERRGDFLVQLEPELMARYERALAEHGAPAAFAIDDIACGGCGHTPSAGDVRKLRQNPGKPFDCSHCHRLNVWVGAPEN